MDQFLHIALSFPTVVFSLLLALAVAYWLLAMVGLFDLDALDFSAVPEGAELEVGGLSGLLMKFGLDGIPLTLIATAWAFFAWLIVYFFHLLVLQPVGGGWLGIALGAAALLGGLVIAVPLAGLALYPLKPLFVREKAKASHTLLGRNAIVRSPEVDESQGTAAMEDGGAGLILQVRAEPGHFKRGDSVVLVEYLPRQNAYRVIKG